MGFDSRARRGSASRLVVAVTLVAWAAFAQAARAQEAVPKFDKAYLTNQANIEVGKKVWTTQCRHCHGASAYPGKAPKLSPGDMEPDFIFDRVTNGFRKMPAWKAVFSLAERKGVVAYIKSNEFSP
ncbi:MAG: cytochrome c [Quisquiliibacterium sp.]